MSAVSAEAGAVINHVMGCRDCFAPAGRYCAAGLELHLASLAQFIATREHANDRNRIYRRERDRHPEQSERLGELVKAILDARSEVVDG